MTERPILFKGEMVRAILDGRKTMTRRIVKVPLHCRNTGCEITPGELSEREKTSVDTLCPYGGPGARILVKETFAEANILRKKPIEYRADYSAEDDAHSRDFKWKPAIFMRRDQSRITLEVTGVRVERLQEISKSDALAEGVKAEWSNDQGETPGRTLYFSDVDAPGIGWPTPKDAFKNLWDSINGKGSWEINPWVFVLTFKKL